MSPRSSGSRPEPRRSEPGGVHSAAATHWLVDSIRPLTNRKTATSAKIARKAHRFRCLTEEPRVPHCLSEHTGRRKKRSVGFSTLSPPWVGAGPLRGREATPSPAAGFPLGADAGTTTAGKRLAPFPYNPGSASGWRKAFFRRSPDRPRLGWPIGSFEWRLRASDSPSEPSDGVSELPTTCRNLPTAHQSFRQPVGTFRRRIRASDSLSEPSDGVSELPMARQKLGYAVGTFRRAVGRLDKPSDPGGKGIGARVQAPGIISAISRARAPFLPPFSPLSLRETPPWDRRRPR